MEVSWSLLLASEWVEPSKLGSGESIRKRRNNSSSRKPISWSSPRSNILLSSPSITQSFPPFCLRLGRREAGGAPELINENRIFCAREKPSVVVPDLMMMINVNIIPHIPSLTIQSDTFGISLFTFRLLFACLLNICNYELLIARMRKLFRCVCALTESFI